MKRQSINRRNFLSKSAASGAALTLAGLTVRTGLSAGSPNDTIQVGIVGPGGRGRVLMKEFFSFGKQYNARLVAVCDIWNRNRERAAASVKKVYGTEPKVYRHMDQILEDEDLDALIIATADHQHARMLEMAVKSGKDVYCEKPMANVLDEANAALAAVKSSGRIVQIGTQRRSEPRARQAMKLMQEGVIGDVVKVDLIWNTCSPYRWALRNYSDAKEVASLKESDVDWKAFLMGKKYRPFDPRIYRCFRLFRDFSSGIIDQWMTHGIDLVHMLTGQPYPISAVAHGGIYQYHDYRENPDTIQVLLEYGQGDQKFLATYATSLINGAGRSTRVQGTQGTLTGSDSLNAPWQVSGEGIADWSDHRQITEADDRILKPQEILGDPNTMHHMANWLACIRGRDPAGIYCPVEAGYGHSVACIMSAEALWSGRRMVFDPEKQTLAAA